VPTREGPRVIMVNGNRQLVTKERKSLSILYFDRYTLDLATRTENPNLRWREPRERFLNELFLDRPKGPNAASDQRFSQGNSGVESVDNDHGDHGAGIDELVKIGHGELILQSQRGPK